MKSNPNRSRKTFNKNYKVLENGCWEWTGQICWDGYGKLSGWLAHILSWIYHKGEIPKGLKVCHKCDYRRCINPEHLFIGTQKDNMQDCVRKGRLRSDTTKAILANIGNPRSEETKKRISQTKKKQNYSLEESHKDIETW